MAADDHSEPRLSSFELFADLPAEELSALESAMEAKRLPQGKDVFRQGEPVRYCYFILEGRISIWHRLGEQEEQIRVLEAGEIFGEEAVLGAARRHASAFVESDAAVLRISSAAIRDSLRNLPKTDEMLRAVARGRRLVRGASFSWLDPDEAVFLATRKTNFLLVPSLALPILLGFFSMAGFILVFRQGWDGWAYLVPGAGVLAALVYGFWSALDWSNDYYLVTNRRIVALRRIPLIYDDRQETPLDMIQSVAVTSTVNQRAFGFGDVAVRTFTRPIVFQSVPNPNAVARMVETIWKRRQQAQEQDDREEIGRLLAERLSQRQAGEASLEETDSSTPAMPPGSGPEAPSGSLGGIQTRVESGNVVTYRKHRFFLVRNTFLPVLLSLSAIPLGAAANAGILPIGPAAGMLTAAGVMLGGAAWAAYEYLDWANDLYQITPDQILALHRRPLGDEERRAAGLENILSLEYDRPSLLARLLNFGTVKATVGQVILVFEEVGDPVHVQEDIFRRMESKKRRMTESERRRRREEIADWIEAYHHLARPESEDFEQKE
ncbi:MAG: cyclic nucleotide-binding domain-containing protein [Anaerolineales bacterium]|nr:cyclic nucleotide-binding domain-containing protein [Anaerolineales bacterium]